MAKVRGHIHKHICNGVIMSYRQNQEVGETVRKQNSNSGACELSTHLYLYTAEDDMT